MSTSLVRIKTELLDRIKKLAEKEDRSVRSVLERIVTEYLGKR